MRRCAEGGLLVGAGDQLGAGEDAYWGQFSPRFGCARLRCSQCGEAVVDEVIDGLRRRYRCRCHERVVVHPCSAPNPEEESPFAEPCPWACGGHPDLEGVDDAAVLAALDDLGSVPPRLRQWPGFAAARLAAASPVSRARVLDLLASVALTDTSDVRLARSTRALAHFPLSPAAGRLVEAPLDRWRRRDPDVPFEQVSMTVARVLGPRVDPTFGDAAALRVLHALAVIPPGVDFVLFPAVWADPVWAVREATAIAASAPDAWRNLLQALKGRPDDAARVAVAVVGGGVGRDEVTALVAKWPGADSRAAVLAAIGG